MNAPQYLANLMVSTESIALEKLTAFKNALLSVNGVESVTITEAVAYLKVDNSLLDKPTLQIAIDEWMV